MSERGQPVRGSSPFCFYSKLQDPHLRILHLGYLVHRLVIKDALNSLSDDAVSHRQHGLIGIINSEFIQESAGPHSHRVQRFDIGRPFLTCQIGNESPREISPIALAQQFTRLHLLVMRRCDNLTRSIRAS